MLRSLKQARYAAERLGISPSASMSTRISLRPFGDIRDLIVHRILKWALDHPKDAPAFRKRMSPQRRDRSPRSIRTRTSKKSLQRRPKRSARANGAERELMDWKTASIYGGAPRRGIRRADHFRPEIRLFVELFGSLSWKACCRSNAA